MSKATGLQVMPSVQLMDAQRVTNGTTQIAKNLHCSASQDCSSEGHALTSICTFFGRNLIGGLQLAEFTQNSPGRSAQFATIERGCLPSLIRMGSSAGIVTTIDFGESLLYIG